LLVELGKVDEWLDGQDIPDGAPFLIGPDGVYDVVLNNYFLSFRMVAAFWGSWPRTWLPTLTRSRRDTRSVRLCCRG
jgi:hypothetical protein